jgi:alpha-beta hydrolase superfamily lysophospholipase
MSPKRILVAIIGIILSIALFFVEQSAGGLNPADKKQFSDGPGSAASPEKAVEDLLNSQSEDHAMQWFYGDTQAELKGIALVIHGLNLRPDRMQPIVSELTGSGIDVLALSLRGHGENYARIKDSAKNQARLETFKNVSSQLWLNEAYLAYLQLKARGAQKDVPLFLAAFSLGGLIGLDLLASNADVKFDKLILFAPAIRLRPTIYLERVLSPFPHLVIPSMAPATYLANQQGTPIAAYNALFDTLNRFNQNADQKLNVPSLVFIDKRDEFIPLGKLKELVAEKKWTRWQFYIVEKDKTAEDERFYHHIIDASSTGKAVWREMMKAAMNHLLDHTFQ